jgi:hypothetical protein
MVGPGGRTVSGVSILSAAVYDDNEHAEKIELASYRKEA